MLPCPFRVPVLWRTIWPLGFFREVFDVFCIDKVRIDKTDTVVLRKVDLCVLGVGDVEDEGRVRENGVKSG